jgi:hypothetical protein
VTDPDSRPARQQLADALAKVCPRGWVWITDERTRADDERTRVHLLQRTIEPGKFGSTAAHRLGFTVTVTVPSTDVAAAEDQLDDDVLVFLYSLTGLGIQWTTATKAVYDGRLGYQLGLEIGSNDMKGKL